ncbi:lytic polysaccharide monooxygenase [Actinosynnema pretiosum subsp. pretiosum]|uniref:Chitin-binding domain 3 protein n=2 Tax=Actinosynnema TaxID=40566 RepID=C6W982_ACTMD|nr:lytic polysaccharide monooxygenase [Actinosynnema mirum]ACU39154.1 chitin-binding domain 3 protein [Actinosynnema mirum DSM 43827]AXX32753.1 Chitin binding protein [Actinosynnema pretiosum subsp. pretiosum]QUF03370.1 lytic polysaccharide monooxygenase [Actinosynnema pretiosum subsp. pretiosum]
MEFKRKLAAVLAGVGVTPFIVVLAAGSASAHGYISSPPSRQAFCAQGAIPCGNIKYEPQSVEGPKGLTSCDAGLSQFSELSDDSRNWPTTSVGGKVTFNWTLTARHATATWQYFIGGQKIAEFNDGNKIPGATVSHSVDLGGRTGKQKVLAVWNIGDTPMAFYNCVDLQVGGGGSTDPKPEPTTTSQKPPTTTQPPSSSSSAPKPTTTSQKPPSGGGEWAPNTPYKTGDQVTYSGATYKCIQGHTTLLGWEPSATPALWQRL